MCHAVNQGVRQLIATGIPFSASVMIACPWYLEAAEILRQRQHRFRRHPVVDSVVDAILRFREADRS